MAELIVETDCNTERVNSVFKYVQRFYVVGSISCAKVLSVILEATRLATTSIGMCTLPTFTRDSLKYLGSCVWNVFASKKRIALYFKYD